MKKQKPDTRMGYDFEDAKTQRKTRSSLKRQLHSKERMLVKKQLLWEVISLSIHDTFDDEDDDDYSPPMN